MRLIVFTAFLIALSPPAICQTTAPAAKSGSSEQIRIQAFQTHKRGDGYDIADFTVSNETDKLLNSIQMTCWSDDDRAHATTVLVWPSPGAIPAHATQQFSNVNIGLLGADSPANCKVTDVQ